MEDFIELGIEGVDKLVDGHFEKLPSEALHLHTYHPKNLKKIRKSKRKNSRRESSPSPTKSTSAPDPRKRASDMDSAVPYGYPPQYSREPPHVRPEYMPSPPPMGAEYYSSAVTAPTYPARGREYEDSYASDSRRRSPQERPRDLRRRSSSYHGPRNREYDSESEEEDNERALTRKRRDSWSNSVKTREKGHHGFKEEVEKNFTKSPAGITGGVVGAVVGGWVAKKAQAASGREGKHGKGSNAAVTLLGAAVGGLAVNAIIDKWEDRKIEREDEQERREERSDSSSESDSDDGRSHRGSRRSRRGSRGPRDSRDSWDDSRDERRGHDRYD